MKKDFDYIPLLDVASKLEWLGYRLSAPGALLFGFGLTAGLSRWWKVGLGLVVAGLLVALIADMITEYALRRAKFKR